MHRWMSLQSSVHPLRRIQMAFEVHSPAGFGVAQTLHEEAIASTVAKHPVNR